VVFQQLDVGIFEDVRELEKRMSYHESRESRATDKSGLSAAQRMLPDFK
jgi:hypothetical protein